MKNTQKNSIFFLLVLFFSCLSPGWGGLGHWTVARIADYKLSAVARVEVANILKNNDTLYTVSTLPDQWKSQAKWKFTANYHFDTVPDEWTYLQAISAQSTQEQKNGGVVEAIINAIQILKNRKYSENTDEVRNALIFLTHFVGDIHQPLHVGKPGDLGGNQILVNWMGKNINLHSLWDTQMILSAHKSFISGSEIIENSKKYATYLLKSAEEYSPTRTTNPEFSIDQVDNWIHEGMILRKDLYLGYDKNQTDYQNKFIGPLDQLVYLAGNRLAQILNQILDVNEDQSQSNFQKQIEAIVGKIKNLILFLPSSSQSQDMHLN